MTSTTTTYLSIEKNLSRYQKLATEKPAVKTASAYYKANIGAVKSADKFVSNYRLLSYALQAYGLGDQVNNKALVKKVLEQGATSPHALANILPNANWKRFAAAFDFNAKGAAAPSSSASQATATAAYVEQQLESDQGADDPGVQLALYFKRVAPTVKDGYSVLADKNLLQVVQTIFNLPPTASAAQIDKQAIAIKKLVPAADLQDPKKLEVLVQRFTAAYESKYGPGSDATTSLTVYDGNTATHVSAASTVLSGIVSSNSTLLSSWSSTSSSQLINLPLGG